MPRVPNVTIIYASTSGHTEFVTEKVEAVLAAAKVSVRRIRAELAKPEDFLAGDAVILASGSWNTGGIEGQMNPHMHELFGRAKDVKLDGKRFALIALGDTRYRYTARAGEHMRVFVQTRGGKILEPPLTIVNEPYGQEEKMETWARKLLSFLAS